MRPLGYEAVRSMKLPVIMDDRRGGASPSSLERVEEKLTWLREQGIWPNGTRYLWTDAFGVVLLVSLYRQTQDPRWLNEARWLVDKVERVLGRAKGLRIGEAEERDGQYFHYLAMWLFALSRLGEEDATYRQRGIELARTIHAAFVVPDKGVLWKMQEDLSGPYPGYGYGALDPYHGYAVYHLLGERELAPQIGEMSGLINASYPELTITQDLGLGMMLWLSHFFPDEAWAQAQQKRCLTMLDRMWQDEGYFCRQPHLPYVKFAFTNFGVSVGLQSVRSMHERVVRLNRYFETYRSQDEYDRDAITHIMQCCSYLPGALIDGSPI